MKYLTNFNTLLEYEDAGIIDVPNVSYIVEDKIVKYAELPIITNKYILYTSTNGLIINPYNSGVFGALLISNEYNDFGLIRFNAPVTSIGNSAFDNCSSLTSINIPESVTSIGNGAFRDCYKLTSIIIPDGVISIGDWAFAYCSNLASITIQNNVRRIGSWVFYNCYALTSITIPNRITSIGLEAFKGCIALTSITCEATTPPTLGLYNALSSVTAVYVPAESVDTYRAADGWSYYADKIHPIQ